MDDELERFRSDWRREVQGRRAPPRSGDRTRRGRDEDAPRIARPADSSSLARNHIERLREPDATNAVTFGEPQRDDSATATGNGDDDEDSNRDTPSPSDSEEELPPDVEALKQSTALDEPATERPLTALELYERGVLRERQGALSDALVHYRMAFKKDPNVDRVFRDAFRAGTTAEAQFDTPSGGNSALEDTGYAKFVQTTPDYDAKKGHTMSDEMASMMKMMASLRMPIEAEEGVRDRKNIADLPEEVLSQVVHHAIVGSAGSAYTALSLTCQKLFLMTLERSVWRALCLRTYWQQVYLDEGVRLRSSSEYGDYRAALEAEVGAHYGGDWQRMFVEKPRVRYDGIYIATCNYTRPGAREETLEWTSPVHLITYFRYARFHPDGRCLTLLTTTEPKDVVHQIRHDSKLKDLQRGTWALDRANGTVCIDTRGPADYLFFITLQCKSSSRGRQNKLAWRRFYGVHPVSGAETEFKLKHDRSYYFSKVKSYNPI